MEKKDFNSLLIQLGSNTKCVLVLGPEFININSNEADFTESIQDYLTRTKFPVTEKNYFSEDGFLYYDNETDNSDMLINLSTFYRELKVTESYIKLARIPFTSIISLSPDDLIVQAYKMINKDYNFCSYQNEGFEEGPLETSKSKPLIYNLAGHYDVPMNLVFTFDNLFSFLNKLFQDTVFQNVRKHIIQANSFLFLGFNYDKWYLKLIFFLLNKFREDKPKVIRNAIFDYRKKELEFNSKIECYKASFKLNFSPENEKEFIDNLFEACRTKGILTDVNTVQGVDSLKLSDKAGGRYKILFLGSSPLGKLVLRIGEEYFDIDKVLNKDFYELLEPKFNIRKNDIQSQINNKFPNLVYFTCHGTPEGELILSTENNKPDKFPLQDLKDIIEHLVEEHKQITCIVFSACKSEIQAKEISAFIPYCIGMSEPVSEKVGLAFTEGFFQGFIRDKQNIEYAFTNAVQAIKNHGDEQINPFFNIPVLYKNGEKYIK